MPFIGSAHGAVSYGRAKRGATWVNGGVVTTLAGVSGGGRSDGTGTNASFAYSLGVALLKDGNLIVTDYNGPSVRLVTYPNAVVTTLAGKGNVSGTTDGTGSDASFNAPWGVAVLQDGNIAVAERNAGSIRIITYPGGVVSTLVTGLSQPRGIATLADGNLIVCDSATNSMKRVTYPAGVVTTIAGGTSGYADGVGTNAQFNTPTAVTVMPNGTIAVVDYSNSRIRLITYPGGVVTTLAGDGTSNSVNGTGTNASFNGPYGISATPDGKVIVVESSGARIRVITSSGVTSTLAGNGNLNSSDGTGTNASFIYANNLLVLPDAKIVVLDGNHTIRLIT